MNDSEETTHTDGEAGVWGATEFVPGPDVGLVGHQTFGLIESGHPGTRDQLWALVANDAPIDDILDALSANGLKALPSFGLAQLDGEELRVVARGRTRIVAVGSDGSEQMIDPSGVRTWIEEVVSGATHLSIRLLGDQAEGQDSSDRFFVLAGSVPASSLTRSFAQAEPLADVARQGWEPGSQFRDGVTDTAEFSSAVAALEVADSKVAGSDSGSVEVPGAEGAPSLQMSLGSFGDDEPNAVEVNESEPVVDREVGPLEAITAASEVDAAFEALSTSSQDAEEPADALVWEADLLPLDSNETISSRDLDEFDDGPPGSAVPDNVAAVDEEGAADGDNYDFIYGHTVARSVEGAAVRLDESPEGDGLISAVPASTGGAQPTGDHDGQTNPSAAHVADPHQMPGDHDGLTMSRAQLDAMRNSAPTSNPGKNEVLAVLCNSGHPNPPQAAACRSCGVALGTARPLSVPRPPLGLLVFSNGDRVVADRSILIGRNPRVTGTSASELPRVVKFEDAGQGLSRTHAEVRIEGWQLLLEDLQSTNGTEVTLPGQTPRRLHAGDPVVLVPGTSIDFGEELTCVVEVAP